MPFPQQLLQIDFDQFHRYAAVAVLLKPLIAAEKRSLRQPIRILEVGCHSLNLLPGFLAPLPIEVVRADVEPHFEDGTGPYFQLRKDEHLPFTNESFDYAVALEVLEHIPGENRAFAVGEWARVVRKGLVLSCPNGKRVRRSERRADRAYRQRHENKSHPWLDEHEQFGQPTPREVRALCDQIGLDCRAFANSPLAEWLPLLMTTEEILETGSPELYKRFNEMLNLRPFRRYIKEAPYRRIYAAFKSEITARQAMQLYEGASSGYAQGMQCGKQAIDPVRLLTRAFCGLLKQKEESRVDHQYQTTLERERGELQVRLKEAERQLLHQGWLLEATASRRSRWQMRWRGLKRKLGLIPSRYLMQAEVHEIRKIDLGCWISEGADPRMIWQTTFVPGWHRIVLRGHALAGEKAKLYLDFGQGFSEHHAFTLGHWAAGPSTMTKYVFFHQPVKQWRLDPAEAPTPFVLDHARISPVRTWQIMARGLARLFLRGVVHPLRTWNEICQAMINKELSRYCLAQAFGQDELSLDMLSGYQVWLQQQRPSAAQRHRLIKDWESRSQRLAVVLQASGHSLQEVERTIRSLVMQDVCAWEMWLSAPEAFRKALEAHVSFRALRKQVHWIDAGADITTSRVCHMVLEKSRADYLLLLEAGDELEPDACIQFLEAGRRWPKAALIYSDEDVQPVENLKQQPILKPDPSPETFRSQPSLLGRAVTLNAHKLKEHDGLHPGYEGGLLEEYLHRLLDMKQEIAHIRRILLHRLEFKKPSHGKVMLLERLQEYRQQDIQRRVDLQGNPLISIIIPSAGKMSETDGRKQSHLARCLASIRSKSTYSHLELLVVHNGPLTNETMEVTDRFEAERVLVPGKFNFSRNLNRAAQQAHGDHLLFLNDDTEIITPDWLERLLWFSCQDGVGAVGAKLLFPTGSLQHVGIALSHEGPCHPYYGASAETAGYLDCCKYPKNWIAVTGACLMTSRKAFEAVNGLDESFELNYNDVDYCLRLLQAGYRSVCNTQVELYHYEAMRSDGRASYRPEELKRFNARWQSRFPVDPYFTPEPQV